MQKIFVLNFDIIRYCKMILKFHIYEYESDRPEAGSRYMYEVWVNKNTRE